MKRNVLLLVSLLSLVFPLAADDSVDKVSAPDRLVELTPELHDPDVAALVTRGVALLPDEAVAIEGPVTTPDGAAATSKMLLVPFTTQANAQRGYFIKASVTLQGGTMLAEYQHHIFDAACQCLPGDGDSVLPASSTAVSAQWWWSPWNDAWLLSYWVSIRNFVAVSNWIRGMLARGIVDAILAPIIRWAFESNGYRCPNPPWWVPLKSMVYMTTCARRVY